MFTVIYAKSTKQIIQYREDLSSENRVGGEDFLKLFCKDTSSNINNYSCAIIEKPEFEVHCLERHLFDEQTQTVVQDPNWVAPRPMPEDVLPVSDPAGS
jgi:hypothetical protein